MICMPPSTVNTETSTGPAVPAGVLAEIVPAFPATFVAGWEPKYIPLNAPKLSGSGSCTGVPPETGPVAGVINPFVNCVPTGPVRIWVVSRKPNHSSNGPTSSPVLSVAWNIGLGGGPTG